jgi:Flp pilus assembly protein TadG
VSKRRLVPSRARNTSSDRRARLWHLAKAADGNVLIEFAFVAPIFVVLIVNILDFSTLIWDQMEVDYSSQMGAQAAYKTCSTGPLPAESTSNCPNLSTQVTTAIQSTSLGTAVTLATGSPSEIYYCVSGTTLQSVATYPSSPPTDCTAYGNAGVTPGDYLEVDVTYSYSPSFAGLSLASARTLTGKSVERLK